MEIAWPAFYIVPRILYSQKREQIVEIIGNWSKDDAKRASEWESLRHGVLNVCYCSDMVSFQELNKLLAEVKRLDREPRDLVNVDFLWNRLAETGLHGEAIVSRFINFRDALEGASEQEQEI